MNNVKIRKYWKFNSDVRPQNFSVVFSDGIKGNLEISRIIEEMKLTVERDITSIERKELLIEIFNKICINRKRFKLECYDYDGYMPGNRKVFGKNVHVTDNMSPIEQYKFIVNDEEKEKSLSIIDELILNYKVEDFSLSKKEERLIYHIKCAYDKLKELEKADIEQIKLQNLDGLSELEIGIYFNILERLCSKLKLRGSFDHINNIFLTFHRTYLDIK